VLNQYCSNSITNKGVEFPSIPRIFSPVFIYALAPTPSTGMSSPPYALFSQLSATEDKTIVIHFTAPQSHVGMKVGLDRKYSATVFAHLAVYSSDTPSTSTELDADTVTLGKGPTDITQPLEVTRTSADIRSAVVDFYTLAYGVHAVEIIDDLTFSTVGPTCITDWNPPSVQITQPAADGAVLQTVKNWVAFTATDTESGIAKVTVSFLDAAGAELEGFNACTGSMPCTGPNAKTQQGDFYTSIPEGCKTIRVQAWDYVGRTGQAQRQVSVLLPGPNMNLWARALEITQGTQPWLPTNSTTRLSGSTPPSYTYPAVPTSVPLVAGRKTVVRLFAGVEGTKSGAQVVNVRAKLKCFTNATYAVPFPGVSEISPQTQPPDLLDEITVSPTVSLDTQRRDTRLSWNFVLPDAWTQAGTIYLEARVEAPYGVPECVGCDDAANRIRVAAVPFNSVPSFSANLVTLVRVIRTLGTNVYTPTVQQVNAAVNYLAARYPVDETTVHTAANLDLKFTDYFNPPIEGGSRCKYLMAMLKLGVWNIGKKAVFALVDLQGGQTNGFPCGGLGGSGYAFGSDGDGFCEEVGHAVGLNHSGPPPGHGVCNAECDHGWCDTDWPYPHGNVGAFGFNIMTMQVVPDKYVQCLTPGVCDNGINEDNDMIGTSGCPALDIECPGAPDPNPPADWTNAPHDIMSYGPCFKYISPRNWIRLFNAFTGSNLAYPKNPSAPNPGAGAETAPVTLAAASDRLEIGAPARYLMVRGAENPEGAWVLLPAYEMEYPAGTSDAAGAVRAPPDGARGPCGPG
jgi:hypothetical protein